jgi:hypothetical protein
MELDLQSLFGLHVHSCTYCKRPRNASPQPTFGSYTRVPLVSQDRRHLFVTPCTRASMRRTLIGPSHHSIFLYRGHHNIHTEGLHKITNPHIGHTQNRGTNKNDTHNTTVSVQRSHNTTKHLHRVHITSQHLYRE